MFLASGADGETRASVRPMFPAWSSYRMISQLDLNPSNNGLRRRPGAVLEWCRLEGQILMLPFEKALVLAVLAVVGLWGCAQGPSGHGAAAGEKVKALEQEVSKLEEDFRVAAAARDQVRQRLTAVEEQRNQLAKEVTKLKATVKER